MKKITYQELLTAFKKYNREHGIIRQFDGNALYGVVVFKESNFETPYSLEERSYKVSSANKRYIDSMCGSSVFGTSLDGSDVGVRLDMYDWEIDYCYLLNEKENN